jgi:hypothetical protein
MSNLSLKNLASTKNRNLLVGLVTLLVILWAIMFAIPSLFISLFYTVLGNIILVGFIVLAGMYNLLMGIGLAIVFIILYRFSHMRIEDFII